MLARLQQPAFCSHASKSELGQLDSARTQSLCTGKLSVPDSSEQYVTNTTKAALRLEGESFPNADILTEVNLDPGDLGELCRNTAHSHAQVGP